MPLSLFIIVKDIEICPENELLDDCLNPCPPDTCRAHGKTFKCRPIDVCIKGCKCKLNYKRNPKGKCILIDQCCTYYTYIISMKKMIKTTYMCVDDHQKCDGPNEVYSRCENDECQKTCRNNAIFSNTRYRCKGKCEPGCICEKGYVKNDHGKCVRPDDCGIKNLRF